MAQPAVFTEVFPIKVASLPKLSTYKLNISGNADITTIGGKLSYRLRAKFGGRWVWTSNHLLTDSPNSEIINVVQELWKEQPDIFKHLQGVQPANWKPSPQAQADFVARGLVAELHKGIQSVLAENAEDIGNARVERVYTIRGWVVDSNPAISISIASRLIYKQDLKTYIASNKQRNLKELITGLWVAEKTGTLKGEIVDLVGSLKEERNQLLHLTQREEMQDLISNAPDDELVVWVLAGRNEYKYIESALRIILRTEDLKRFRINPKRALNTLQIEPKNRAQLVKSISDLLKQHGYVGNAYNSIGHSKLFSTSQEFSPILRFGNGQTRKFNGKTLMNDLRTCGVFKKNTNLADGNIQLGIVNALTQEASKKFIDELQGQLAPIGFKVSLAGEQFTKNVSRSSLEQAVNILEANNPDILLGLFPDEYSDDEKNYGNYHHFKSLTVGRGIPSQVVNRSTLSKKYAFGNIVLGILGKTGNIPFVLAESLPYADLVVGIDIARERKKRLAGSINATAIARIYFNDGNFLRYVIHDAPLEGETIPENVLQALFPANEFGDKRVVIHRDGYFRGQESASLKSWAKHLGAEFNLVEVIKSGTPRLYNTESKKIQRPEKGDIFKLSPTEAFVVSSPPPFGGSTPLPLRIRTQRPFDIDRAVHSVLALTILHYWSLLPPRLPVTIHYSDRIAYLALRGIKPKNLDGFIPFWL